MSNTVTEAILYEIIEKLELNGVCDDAYLTQLKSEYSDIRFTLCSDNDTGVREPFRECNYFDLHLVAFSQTGCSQLTSNIDSCSGVAIALHE
jgi:hypothetical protein